MVTTPTSPKSPRDLYRIGKRSGVWDPEQIPVAEDRADWQRLTPDQQEQLLKVCSLFYEGEVSVADTLAWWLVAMPGADRRALVLGVTHYMGVIEGVLAVSGYDYFDELLVPRAILPRLLQGIRLIRADEGRHITVGMDFLRERLAACPELAEPVRQLFLDEGVKIPARIDFIFATNPFGLDRDRLMAIAYDQLAQRSREIGLA